VTSAAYTAILAVNVAIGIAVFVTIAFVLRTLVRVKDIAVVQLVLGRRQWYKAAALVLTGVLIFLSTNMIELVEDSFGVRGEGHELLETLALLLQLAGLLRLERILRQASSRTSYVHVELSEDRP